MQTTAKRQLSEKELQQRRTCGLLGGRPKGRGEKAIAAFEARKYFNERLQEDLKPIVSKMISEAKKGDWKAAELLFNRAWGKPTERTENTNLQLTGSLAELLDALETRQATTIAKPSEQVPQIELKRDDILEGEVE